MLESFGVEHPRSSLSAGQKTGSFDRSRAQATILKDGPVTQAEARAWYFYDWCFSPYWQVADTTFKWFLLRLAKQAQKSGDFVDDSTMSTGAYPAAVLFINSGVQVVMLLTFSAFADYGNYRKVLLRWSTYACCAFLLCAVFCNTGSMVWMAGLLRICMGCVFVLTNVYYNAYLPLLTSQSPEVLELTGEAAEKKQEELSDSMSSKGFACGYCGGMSMQIVVFFILLFFQCDRADVPSTCTASRFDFDKVFWIGFCISLCGVWWLFFSCYTFAHLKERAGGPFPEGSNILCLGWQKAWETLFEVWARRNTLIYVVGYFIWSDAIATVTNVGTLYLVEMTGGDPDADSDDGSTADSDKMKMLIAATLLALIGVFLFLNLQTKLKLSSKTLLLIQLCAYGFITLGAACGAMSAFNGMGYYLCMAPMMMMLGSQQAFQRSIYGSLSPAGKEAQMFAFYTITDKGSSLIGYAVMGVVHTKTKSYQGVWWYCAFAFFFSAVILCFVDVQQGIRDAGKGDK